MLNAIGLQNPGIDVFCERDIPFLKKYDTKIIVNVCGKTTEDYCEVVERLADAAGGYAGDQHFLPQREGRRHCLRPGSESGGGHYQSR